MKIVQFFWCRWKFSFFSENSRFLKVLAHEMSDEIKKIIFSSFMVWWKDVSNQLSHDANCANFLCWYIFSILGRNSLFLKVLAHEMSEEIQKKLKFSNFMVWWWEVFNKLYQDENCAILLVLMEIYIFQSKFSIFKGVSPRN